MKVLSGSHGVLIFGDQRTVVRNPKGELKTGTLSAMLKQLGLSRNEISRRSIMFEFAYPARFAPDK
jgi:hypothetical protein